jgi:hypothetical protein
MFASRSRYGGSGRASIASHGESWATELDDTTESDFDDDAESESTDDELPVVRYSNPYPQRQFSQPPRPREHSYPNNSSSNAPGIFASQLLNSSRPATEGGSNGSHFLRSLFSAPEAQPTTRSGGQSASRVAPRDPGRAEREAALRNVGARVEVIGVTQDYRFDHNVSTRPCDLSLRVLENLKWVAFNFKRELPGYTITKIEFILNDRLYERFQKTRDEFTRLGKSTKEMLLYHGTAASNVSRFKGWWG